MTKYACERARHMPAKATSAQTYSMYRKVASSRPVYYSISLLLANLRYVCKTVHMSVSVNLLIDKLSFLNCAVAFNRSCLR